MMLCLLGTIKGFAKLNVAAFLFTEKIEAHTFPVYNLTTTIRRLPPVLFKGTCYNYATNSAIKNVDKGRNPAILKVCLLLLSIC